MWGMLGKRFTKQETAHGDSKGDEPDGARGLGLLDGIIKITGGVLLDMFAALGGLAHDGVFLGGRLFVVVYGVRHGGWGEGEDKVREAQTKNE